MDKYLQYNQVLMVNIYIFSFLIFYLVEDIENIFEKTRATTTKNIYSNQDESCR